MVVLACRDRRRRLPRSHARRSLCAVTGTDVGEGGPVAEGTLLWEPTAERVSAAHVTRFLRWLEDRKGLVFTGYDDLWRWSVDHLEDFWSALWSYFEMGAEVDAADVVRRGDGAEGARWFPGVTLNYSDRLLRQPAGDVAVVAVAEEGEPAALGYGELRDRVGAVAAGLRRLGVEPGDRVAAVLGNGLEAVVGFLATASLGAVWSSCAPEFGAASMTDRFAQIAPKVLLCATGYRYGGRTFDLSAKLADLERALPGLGAVVLVPGPGTGSGAAPGPPGPARLWWEELAGEPAALAPVAVPFDHPLWILYSSGTTGLPKPIVHGHGGIVLEHLKAVALHSDLGTGDRFFWFTTTGWMMWNFLLGGLLVGSTIVCYDGDPFWPDERRLWQLAEDQAITYFGTSAPFIEACRRAGLHPGADHRLSIRSIGSTGAPLSPEGFAWAASSIGDDVLVGSVSGGTDVCTAFLAACPILPVRAGELQCRALGADVEAFDEAGRPVVGEVGELVVSTPMPSMPVRLWGDPDGSRLHDSYFARYRGVWRHGDWVKITPGGGAVVYGRSDATLNRGGVRMGTAEFYRVVETLPDVRDALVVDTSELGRQGELVLLVVPASGEGTVDEETSGRLRQALRERLSPRHVPDRIIGVRSLPRTLNGKKVEVPIRRILLGAAPAEAVSSDALADPAALEDVLSALSGAGLL